MRKYYNHKTFKFEHDGFKIEIECSTQDTSYGFRHVARLTGPDGLWTDAKCTYQNRTWESYEYQSVLFEAIRKSDMTPEQKTGFKNLIDKYGTRDRGLDTVAVVAGLADLFTDNQTESNDWKKRMLEAGLGDMVDIPEDWDQLTEDEKTKRLNGAIHALRS